MIKNIFTVLFVLFIGLCSNAEILPYRVSDIPVGTIGVYQTTTGLKTYKSPDKKSNIIFEKTWNYQTVNNLDYSENLFAILKEKKELSFVYATDIYDDFVEVIYDKQQNLKGCAYKEDSFHFLPWISFFNMYGRKYGLKLLKDAPSSILELRSRSDKDSQIIERVSRPKKIRLTTIQGNWALVTILDLDNTAKTGFIQWRGQNGELYLFPAIK